MRQKESGANQKTVTPTSSQWVRGARITGSWSEEEAESRSLPKGIGPRNTETERAHMANHRTGGDSVEVSRKPTSREEGNSQEEKRSWWGKGGQGDTRGVPPTTNYTGGAPQEGLDPGELGRRSPHTL